MFVISKYNFTHTKIKSTGGFTLLELLAVIVISGVIFTFSYPRFHQSNTELLHTANSLLWLLRDSRKKALMFSQYEQKIVLSIDKRTIVSYLLDPSLTDKKEISRLLLPESIIVLDGRGDIYFNYLGETNTKTLKITLTTIAQNTLDKKTINVTGGGYAY